MTDDNDLISTPRGVYEWGRSAELRLRRAALNLSSRDMSTALGINHRSYQRMESGEAAISTTFWQDVERMEYQLFADAAVIEQRAEEHADQTGEALEVVIDFTDPWVVAVHTRALLDAERGTLRVLRPDDVIARAERSG